MLPVFADLWPFFLATLLIGVALVASLHVILNKEDPRAAVGWVAIIWLSPVLGVCLYIIFGINRIRRRALALRQRSPREFTARDFSLPHTALSESQVREVKGFLRLGNQINLEPLTVGNRVKALVNGDVAYAAMLEAIHQARSSITLLSYIFDRDRMGKQFVEALGLAVGRGVEVRVLVDAAGARYSWPSVIRTLKKTGVPVARFLSAISPWRLAYLNLRNHRKILVVDGKRGFTGGMNIREGNVLKNNPKHPIQDLHFELEGPVVAHLQDAFVSDWSFTTGEKLQGDRWFPQQEKRGNTLARGVIDGPDEAFEKVYWTVLGAIAMAKYSIKIVNPYFLPDLSLIRLLCVSAMSGIQVEILIPEKSNLALVDWASSVGLRQLLENQCHVLLSPPPFDHSKLMIVDQSWVMFGSANWDARSFRLNFEFNVECYDQNLARDMDQIFENKRTRARPLFYSELNDRSLFLKARDGIAHLFTPYL